MEDAVAPPNTNGARRLEVHVLGRSGLERWPTNDYFGNWQCGLKTDLKVYQTYYRSPVNTNWQGLPLDPRRVAPRSRFPRGHPEATNEFPAASQPQSPGADGLLALSKFDAEVEELRRASRLPYSRFYITYTAEPTNGTRTLNLRPLGDCAELLRLRGVAELETGESDKAMDDAKLILYLANSVRDEPTLHWHLWRIFTMDWALQPLWQGLVDRRWSDGQLLAMERELVKFDFPADYQLFVRADRAGLIAELDAVERKRNFRQYWHDVISGDPWKNAGFWDRWRDASREYFPPKGWFYENEIALAEILQKSLRTEAEVERRILAHDVTSRIAEARAFGYAHASPYNYLAGAVCPDLGQFALRFAFAQSCVDRARVACALERCRLANGELPPTLEALSPRFIDKCPHDIINDQPLHYQRKEGGHFLLYSVGWNGTDEGGIAIRNNNPYRAVLDLEQGDWVWPDSTK